MDETERLSQFVAETTYDDLPRAARTMAKTAIRDFVGVALYGSTHPTGSTIADYVHRTLTGKDATIIGDGTASPEGAALANGVAGHAIDFDDTFETIPIHPTAPSFSAALAAAEHAKASSQSVLTGYLIGVETTYRVGHATFPGHYYGGFHSTGTAGTFGAVAATSSVLELEGPVIRRALGIGASGSSSLRKNFGTMTKPYHAGHAASLGMRAARLAQAGFTANESIFTGETGYGAVMGFGDYTPSRLTDGLGHDWAIHELGFKPFPVILMVQAPMEALRRVMIRENLTTESIESVTAVLPDEGADVLNNEYPQNADEAKFTVEFPLAAILRDRTLTLDQLTDEYVQASETQSVMQNVNRVFDSTALGDEFDRYGGQVTVRTTNGQTFTEPEPITPGMPGNPLGEDRLRTKFVDCADTVLDSNTTRELWELLGAFDKTTIDQITDRLTQ